MEIKYKNESLGFHPDFTFVIGGGVRLGFSLPPSREFTRSICCWLGGQALEGHWRGPVTTMLLGLEGASPCLAGPWQGQQWEALVLSRSWHGLTSNHLQEHRLVLSHSCLPLWSQPFVMLANISTSKALHSKEKTSHSSGLTSEPLTHHHWSPHLILLRLLPLRV